MDGADGFRFITLIDTVVFDYIPFPVYITKFQTQSNSSKLNLIEVACVSE